MLKLDRNKLFNSSYHCIFLSLYLLFGPLG